MNNHFMPYEVHHADEARIRPFGFGRRPFFGGGFGFRRPFFGGFGGFGLPFLGGLALGSLLGGPFYGGYPYYGGYPFYGGYPYGGFW